MPLTRYIGNSGTFVDLRPDNSAITLVDILSITRGRHSVRMGGGVIYYRTNVTTNNNRRGADHFPDLQQFPARPGYQLAEC